MNIIEAASDLNIFEETHSEHCEDEHDKEEEETDVEERGERHDQGEEESSDALGSLDQPQHSPNLGYSDYSEKSWRHKILLYKVT